MTYCDQLLLPQVHLMVSILFNQFTYYLLETPWKNQTPLPDDRKTWHIPEKGRWVLFPTQVSSNQRNTTRNLFTNWDGVWSGTSREMHDWWWSRRESSSSALFGNVRRSAVNREGCLISLGASIKWSRFTDKPNQNHHGKEVLILLSNLCLDTPLPNRPVPNLCELYYLSTIK